MRLAAILLISFFINYKALAETYFPSDTWETRTADDVNLNNKQIDKLFRLTFNDHATMGAVLIKDGYIVKEQYANGFDENSFGTSWSTAKSFYAALIGISIDRGEIDSLDDPVSKYVEEFDKPEKKVISIRQILNMTSGLEFPSHEHEKMFFENDHMKYALNIDLESKPGAKFEYNNVNSMLIGEILRNATGKTAKTLINERIFSKIGLDNFTAWEDSAGNTLTYCCLDMSARDYSRFGLLFSRDGNWDGNNVISREYVNETLKPYWGSTPSMGWIHSDTRGYSLQWWISKYDEQAKIYNTSGKFGQFIFIDKDRDIIFTRITKYYPTKGDVQNFGPLKFLKFLGSVDAAIGVARFLNNIGLINFSGGDIQTPVTLEEGESNEFYEQYIEIVNTLATLQAN